jgi:hypothetical protein
MRNWGSQTFRPREVTGLPHFERYIGIDYSGAVTADSSCKGLWVYAVEGFGMPVQVQPPPSPRRYLPSEVVLGRPDQLVTRQQRVGGR